MSKLLIFKGVQASGKTTVAREWQAESPTNRIIVNRDSLRDSRGLYWTPETEGFITELEDFMIEAAMKRNYDIVSDNTNLNPKTINKLKEFARKYNYEVEEKFFPISLELAIERDSKRPRPVGEKVITDFYNKYIKGTEWEKLNT